MKNGILARRYVTAFCQSLNGNERVGSLHALSDVLNSVVKHDSFFQVLNNPLIGADKKAQLMSPVVAKVGALPKLKRFFELLIQKDRVGLFSDIQTHVEDVLLSLRQTLQAQVVSSVDMTASEKQALVTYLESRTSKKIEISVAMDAELIGGFKVQVGHTLFDATVENALSKLSLSLN